MKKNIIVTAALAALVALYSCDDAPLQQDEPQVPDTELKENEYILGEDKCSFESVAASNLGEYICIAASPQEGVESFDDIFEQDEYFYVAISPLLNGKEFDLMTEENLYTVISTLDGVELETVTPSAREEISEGVCTFTCTEGVVSVEISLTLQNGQAFSAILTAEEPGITVNENIFALEGNVKPVRTAFSLLEDGTTALYLTPAGIDYFDELPITTYYAYIILDDNLCHGRTLDVGDVIAVGYADNFNETVVDSNEIPTTGTLNVLNDPEDPARYIVSADLDFSGTTLKLRFDGTTIDANIKEVIGNEVIYDGKTYPIQGVMLDMPSGESVCKVMLRTAMGELIITLPVNFLDGNAHGFSQSPDLYIEFDGKVFSKAEGYSGTVTIGVEGDVMHIDVTNYDNLEITYNGSYEKVQ